MGLGGLSSNHPNFISMPGMHGSYAANMGMTDCDLLIALGVRFDDRVTGQLAAFARHASVIHVDIDPAEIGKNRVPDIPIVGDVKRVLQKLNKVLAGTRSPNASRRRPPRAPSGGRRSAPGKTSIPTTAPAPMTKSSRSTSWMRSTVSPAARPSSPPTSASTRCGPRS